MRIEAWRCIGCGRIEAPQNCIGVCKDQRIELVPAPEHEQALARAGERAAALVALVRMLAATTPRDGEWERCYRDMQARARRLLQASTGPGASGAREPQDTGLRPLLP